LLQTNDEQGRLQTKRYAGAANELEEGDAMMTLPSPTDFEAETLFIWAGLGGQFGTLHSQTLACDDRYKNIPIFALVTLPFEFEGERAERAEKSRKALEQCADGCLALRNEALIELFGAEADLAKVFALQDQWLAHALLTLKGLADAQAIRTLASQTGLGNRLSMGFGRSTGTNRVDQAVMAAFENPLLHGIERHNHHVVVVLCSAKVPSETEMEQARKLTAFAFITRGCEVTVHALRDQRMGDDLYATIFLWE
jgi:cell division GTPase FtsZ